MKILTLTNEQALSLKMYLLTSTNYRHGEESACKELGLELDENGKPKFPNMKSNGEWWETTNNRIEEINGMLDEE